METLKIEPARDRLMKAAKELGAAINVRASGDLDCMAIEARFVDLLIAGIAERSATCRGGEQVARLLLKNMPGDHEPTAALIRLIEDEDGWLACPVLNAIIGLHCALSFRDAASRWLAEAAIQIGELHAGNGPDGFRGDAKAWAARTLEKAAWGPLP